MFEFKPNGLGEAVSRIIFLTLAFRTLNLVRGRKRDAFPACSSSAFLMSIEVHTLLIISQTSKGFLETTYVLLGFL